MTYLEIAPFVIRHPSLYASSYYIPHETMIEMLTDATEPTHRKLSEKEKEAVAVTIFNTMFKVAHATFGNLCQMYMFDTMTNMDFLRACSYLTTITDEIHKTKSIEAADQLKDMYAACMTVGNILNDTVYLGEDNQPVCNRKALVDGIKSQAKLRGFFNSRTERKALKMISNLSDKALTATVMEGAKLEAKNYLNAYSDLSLEVRMTSPPYSKEVSESGMEADLHQTALEIINTPGAVLAYSTRASAIREKRYDKLVSLNAPKVLLRNELLNFTQHRVNQLLSTFSVGSKDKDLVCRHTCNILDQYSKIRSRITDNDEELQNVTESINELFADAEKGPAAPTTR